MTRLGWLVVTVMTLGACDDPVAPCAQDGPAMGIPAFDVVGALRTAGAEVEDRGERLELTMMSTAARDLRVDGHEVLWYEYCTATEAGNDARRFSDDASTFDGALVTWGATPHIYLLAQVILIYEGDDADLLTLLREVVGAPFAEPPQTLP